DTNGIVPESARLKRKAIPLSPEGDNPLALNSVEVMILRSPLPGLLRLLCLLITAMFGLLPAADAEGPTTAMRAVDFLNSIGVNSAINMRGENLQKTIECTKYLGVRWFRSGIEGGLPLQNFLDLHQQTGARFSWGLVSGGSDLPKLIRTGKQLAEAGALL